MIQIKEVLRQKSTYGHDCSEIRIIETHISLIVLTGKYAYKVKKSISNKMLKCVELIERVRLCDAEIKINRKINKDLYIGLYGIFLTKGSIEIKEVKLMDDFIDRYKDIIEIAIKMYQIPKNMLLTQIIKDGNINIAFTERMARDIGELHLSLPRIDIKELVSIDQEIFRPARNNIEILDKTKLSKKDKLHLCRYKETINIEWTYLRHRFVERRLKGAIRECHGDLHCGNIYIGKDGQTQLFDSIEFSRNLRLIDPISEIIFLVVDLIAMGEEIQSIHLLNTWLEITGDYSGTDLIPWYKKYRAMVRSKVIALEQENRIYANLNGNLSKNYLNRNDISSYLEILKNANDCKKPIIIMHGLSGSGKSYLSERISREFKLIRIRSDIERNRLFSQKNKNGLHKNGNIIDQSYDKIPKFDCDKYDPLVSEWLFHERLPELVNKTTLSGYGTIIDATFLKKIERKKMMGLALNKGLRFIIIKCQCTDEVATRRIKKRLDNNIDPSEASIQTREVQKNLIEITGEEEKKYVINYNEDIEVSYVISMVSKALKNNY